MCLSIYNVSSSVSVTFCSIFVKWGILISFTWTSSMSAIVMAPLASLNIRNKCQFLLGWTNKVPDPKIFEYRHLRTQNKLLLVTFSPFLLILFWINYSDKADLESTEWQIYVQFSKLRKIFPILILKRFCLSQSLVSFEDQFYFKNALFSFRCSKRILILNKNIINIKLWEF